MRDDSRTWIRVAPSTAAMHPLYGVGGWLILVVIGMVASPLRAAAELYPIYSNIAFDGLGTEFRNFLYVEIGFNVLLALWSFANVALIFLKHPAFPASLIAMLALSAAFVIGDAMAIKVLMGHLNREMSWGETIDPETGGEIARSVIAAAVWIPYALYSRRVNVTYRGLVRRDDPAAGTQIAEAF